MNTFEDLQIKVIRWGNERNITSESSKWQQLAKITEEVGELNRAVLKNDRTLILDSFGDILVTLIIASEQLNADLVQCLDYAYNEIKDRKGNTINGTFIKD